MKWIDIWAMLESIGIIFGAMLSVVFLTMMAIQVYKDR